MQASLRLSISQWGTIYLTMDGSDPRLPGGAVNPGAEAFNGSSTTTTVIPRDANWKYLDDGTDQGLAWRTTTYPDENWAEGPAELGYGDNDEQTQVSWGSDAGAKQITTYFRRQFDVRDAAEVSAILMEMKRDDGAVVYLNGVEVWRSNMPDGVSMDTLALEGAFAREHVCIRRTTCRSACSSMERTRWRWRCTRLCRPARSDIQFQPLQFRSPRGFRLRSRR